MSLESKLFRILDGKLCFMEGSIKDPSFFVRKIGVKIYDECLQFLEDDIFDDRAAQILLMEDGVWDSSKEKRLKDLPKLIENNKVFYFNNYSNPPARSTYKNTINILTSEHLKLTKIRYKYQYLTADGIASTAMWTEMINYMYSGPEKMQALSYYHNNSLTEEDIREIAISNEWGTYSSLSKSPLRKSPIQMTENQRRLLSWTNIYNNVRTHPEFPGQRVLTDNDAFDGWMIDLNRKENAKKTNKTQFDKLKSNSRNVFMGQSNEQDASEIMSLNSQEVVTNIKG